MRPRSAIRSRARAITCALGVLAGCHSPTDNGKDAGPGIEEWFDPGLILPSTPSSDGTRVFAMGLERVAYAVDVGTGHLIWASSTATGDTSLQTQQILVGITTGTLGCAVTSGVVLCNDKGVVALRASDGAYLWRSYFSDCGICAGFATRDSSAFLAVGQAYQDSIAAVNVHSGVRAWTVGGFGYVSTLSVDSTMLVVGYSDPATFAGAIAGINTATGAVLWRTKLSTALRTTGSATWQGLVLASVSDGNLYAFDRASGSVSWTLAGLDSGSRTRYSGSCLGGTMDQPMIIVNNRLFVSTMTGGMVMIDLPTHAIVNRVATAFGSNVGLPLVADSSAVYSVEGGVLAVHSISDAHVLRSFTVSPLGFCGVAIAGSNVVTTATSGLYAISR